MVLISGIGLALAIALLVYLAFKGHSVIIVAPIAAMVAVVFSAGLFGGHLMANYTIRYMSGFASYASKYFPIYLFGAVFAKLMEMSGYAKAIADFCSTKLGKKNAILSIVVTCSILTYGGVSLFVVAFVVLPIAIELFREADIPKRLIPGTIALGAFTFTMTALPGSPQVQNTIPMRYFGTDSWAAPILGIIASVIMVGLGMYWLLNRAKKARLANEGYGNFADGDIVSKISDENLPNIGLAIVPILIILVVNIILSKFVYVNVDGSYLSEYGNNLSISNYSGTWSVLIGMLVSILFIIVANINKIRNNKKPLKVYFKEAADSCLGPLVNSCAVVGFGSVTKGLAVFGIIQAGILGLSISPLLSEVLSVNVLCGMTASASGGLGAALEALADTYLASGINPEILHRVAAVAAGGMDTLPYNGATITVLALCGMSHKESYLDMFMVSMVFPIIAAIAIAILGSFGIC